MTTHRENGLHSALSRADGLAASTADVWLLIGRIFLAWIFVRSGYGKLFNIEAVANSFPLRGLPSFLAYIAVPFEFFRRHCADLRLHDTLRRSWFCSLHAGRDVQFPPVLGICGRSRASHPGLQLL
jgi:DoxX-like protein